MSATLPDAYGAAWADRQVEAIAAFWSPAAFRFYKAEEVSRVLLRWDEVLDYWRGNAALHAAVQLHFSEIAPSPLSGDWSLL